MLANRGRSRPPPARSLRYHRTRSIGVRTGRPARPAAHSAVADLPVRDGRPDSAVPLSFRLCVFGWRWWWLSIRSQWRLRRRQAGATGHPPPARRRRSLRPRHRVRRTAGGRLHEEGGPWRRGSRAGPPGPRLRRARLFRRGCGLRRDSLDAYRAVGDRQGEAQALIASAASRSGKGSRGLSPPAVVIRPCPCSNRRPRSTAPRGSGRRGGCCLVPGFCPR